MNRVIYYAKADTNELPLCSEAFYDIEDVRNVCESWKKFVDVFNIHISKITITETEEIIIP
jgi:hypothetical protein